MSTWRQTAARTRSSARRARPGTHRRGPRASSVSSGSLGEGVEQVVDPLLARRLRRLGVGQRLVHVGRVRDAGRRQAASRPSSTAPMSAGRHDGGATAARRGAVGDCVAAAVQRGARWRGARLRLGQLLGVAGVVERAGATIRLDVAQRLECHAVTHRGRLAILVAVGRRRGRDEAAASSTSAPAAASADEEDERLRHRAPPPPRAAGAAPRRETGTAGTGTVARRRATSHAPSAAAPASTTRERDDPDERRARREQDPLAVAGDEVVAHLARPWRRRPPARRSGAGSRAPTAVGESATDRPWQSGQRSSRQAHRRARPPSGAGRGWSATTAPTPRARAAPPSATAGSQAPHRLALRQDRGQALRHERARSAGRTAWRARCPSASTKKRLRRARSRRTRSPGARPGRRACG